MIKEILHLQLPTYSTLPTYNNQMDLMQLKLWSYRYMSAYIQMVII